MRAPLDARGRGEHRCSAGLTGGVTGDELRRRLLLLPCLSLYCDEYVELVQKYLAQQVDTAANETVIQPKKLKDVAQSEDLSVLVEIGREILMLLKCILALVLLVVVGIVYIVARLS